MYLHCSNSLNEGQDKSSVQLLFQLQHSFTQVHEQYNTCFVLNVYIILCEYTVLSPNFKIRRLSNTFNQGQYDTNCDSFTPSHTYLC